MFPAGCILYLGDTVGNGRYTILRKLGYGGYSTVWLAQDNSENGSFVALKVVRANADCAREVQIHDVLRGNADKHPGSFYIMMLKDPFHIQGPNGTHDCLAYEVLGPSIARVLQDCSTLEDTTYLTLSCARRLVYQVLLGLEYMHSVGVIHGDLHAANVLFALKDLSKESIDSLRQPDDQISVDIKRLNGPLQPGDPRHLSLDRPLVTYISPDGDVKLSDLGNSFFENDPPKTPETPPEIRSPEMIFDDHISMTQDYWAFGCFVYNIFTNAYPFELGFIYSKESQNDSHLLQLSSVLGPLPAKLKNKWPRYGTYFDEDGSMKKFIVDDDAIDYSEFDDLHAKGSHSTASDTEKDEETITLSRHSGKSSERFNPELYPSIVKLFKPKALQEHDDPQSFAEYTALNPPLRERWLDEKHPNMELEESELVLDLLQNLLTYDPGQRLTTNEILQHVWIRNYCVSGNEPGRVLESAATVLRNKRKRSHADEKAKPKERMGLD